MPNVIKILPQFIANRIAAGEVVGRPESVVKELMENSIDSGATSISLRIKDAGKTLTRVTDNGSGMSEDDAMLCFQRHSTSKIATAEDLENIKTLGFRGEALASICAVAQVELRTGRAGDELSSFIKNQGSEIIESSAISGANKISGTSVSVKNLFFNTPARRNFLKSNQTELKHINDTFIRLAIANPQVSFSFINEDEEIFDLQSADLKTRLIQIYGESSSDSLMEVDNRSSVISIKGYISKPSFTKKTKQDQFLYLNNRYVVSKSLSYAVVLAYGDLLEKGDYPNYFLFLELDPKKFDVNVHPSKLEVKFDDERSVFGFIKNSVSAALSKNDLVVGVDLKSSAYSNQPAYYNKPAFDESGNFNLGSGFTTHIPFKKSQDSNIHELFSKKDRVIERDKDNFLSEPPETGQDRNNQQNKSFVHIRPDSFAGKNAIWQFQKKYIMYQLENTLMIIDQHAAHERILYEQATDRLNSNAELSQQLLIPIYVELNHIDYEIVRGIQKELRALGFDIELLAKKIKITGVPADVRLGDEGKILQDMIDEFKENDVKLHLEKRENLAKSYACKHAIRTGDQLKEDEMLNLIDKLFSTKMPYVCPHGRPTIIKITTEELDKKFARTGF